MISLLKCLKELIQQRNIVKTLSIKNFKSKYVGSFLGITWAIITPLIMAGVINIVFTKVLNVHIDNFPFFVLAAFLPWMFFLRALTESANSMLININILQQFEFRREIIPLSTVFSNFLTFLIGYVVILPLFFIFNTNSILYIWFLPLILLFFLLFTSGLCFLAAALNVITRDVIHFLEIGMLFLFWLTPIFYSLDMVPSKYKIVSYLNPLTIYMVMFRDILYRGKLPSLSFVLSGIAMGVIVILLGLNIFSRLTPKLLKEL